MKKLSIIAIALLCSGLTVLASNHSLELKSDTTKKVKTTKSAVQYTCPMDKDVITNKPGKCPKCGMPLIKKETTKTKTTKKAN